MSSTSGTVHAATPRRWVVLAVTVAVLVAPMASVGAQEDGSTTTSTTAPPTTTEPPPTTIVLDDGDIGIVPPGAEPQDPPPGPPADPGSPDPDGEIDGDEEPPPLVLPDPTPGLNAALAAIEVTAITGRVTDAAAALEEADATVAITARQRRSAIAVRRRAVDLAVAARVVVEALAVNVLVYGDVAGTQPTLDELLGTRSLGQLRDTELRDVASEHAQERLDIARAAMAQALSDEVTATIALDRATSTRRSLAAIHLQTREELSAAIEVARRARRSVGPAILGPTVLESADLVAWWQRFYRGDPPVGPIGDLVDTYLRVAAEEGVVGDIAFAQAVLETGGFTSQHARGFNFAGIGAYDECAPTCGFRFSSLEAGVRAHIHLLRAYAQPGLRTSDLASPPSPLVAPESVGVRGCCPRWTGLTGVWATDPNYDRKVLGIYRLMVETARAIDRQAP